jgi:molecular chaperone GrpE
MNTPDSTPIPGDMATEGAPAPDEQGAAPSSTDAVMDAAASRIATLEAELAEMRDRWMRAEAETQNVRARARREVDETRQYAVQSFARDVVEAAENLKRGLDSIPAPKPGESEITTSLREGFAGVERNLLAVLERNGIKRQDPTGALFDPNLHQAMAEQETNEHPPGTVLQAWTQSWTLNGRLLRPAMVVVAKAPSGAAPQKPGSAS